LFLYTPAAAGGLVEELSERRPSNPEEQNQLFERYRWGSCRPKPSLRTLLAITRKRVKCRVPAGCEVAEKLSGAL
jgi:hypothetical protein